jgi:uncharacterized membrane protein YdbT with pleckstrin-like domain
MQCPSCNATVDPQVRFCPECGAAIAAGAAPPAAVAPPPAPAAAGPAAVFNPPAEKSSAHGAVEDERELWSGSYSAKAMIGTWVLLAVVSAAVIALTFLAPLPNDLLGLSPLILALIVLAVVWLIAAGVLLYRRMSVHYRVTTQRLVHRRGILSVRTDRIELIDVDDITFTQGFVERMLDVGMITIKSSDRSHPELHLVGIDRVKEVSDVIDDARRKERRRHGVHIETI